MRQLGNHSQYERSHTYNGNRTYGRRVNKKRRGIFIIILAVGLIVLFACVGNAVAENKKNEKIQQLTEYGITMFEQEVLSAQVDEMRGEGIEDLTAQIVEKDEGYLDKHFDSDNNTLTMTCVITYYSNDIDQYANVERDSNEATQLYNMFASMNTIKNKYFYNGDESIEYKYELEDVGTVVIKNDNLKDYFAICNNDDTYNFYKSYNGDDSLTLNYNYLYFKSDSSPSKTNSGSSGKTNKCAQCGKPIYADETWCDDCLFGSIGGASSASYDSDYQSNLEKIADAYGVSPDEVDAKIKAVTGE